MSGLRFFSAGLLAALAFAGFIPAIQSATFPAYTTFTLFTRENAQNGETLKFADAASIEASHFNGANPTKVIIHGYGDSVAKGAWMSELKDKLLETEDVNVILVDCSRANLALYPVAAGNARLVGGNVAAQIEALCKAGNTTPASFQVFGHSLGAQGAGFAGKALNGALGRITGLDPAGPSFQGRSAGSRLWHTDAQFVDVIHTDSMRLGMWETCGNVDFYPNGGVSQPGCSSERTESLRKGIACNHMRAYEFYIDSIGKDPEAHECSDYASFTNGRCGDCGENGEKCAILGPKAVEHGNSTTGKRYFLSSNEHRPLF